MKKLLISLALSLSVFYTAVDVKADEKETVNVYMFTKEGCGYCENAAKYFSELSTDKEYGEMFNLVTFKVYDSGWNVINQEFYETLMKVTKKMGDTFGETPYIIVGEKSFDGFDTRFDEDIKEEIKRCYEKGYTDPVANIDKKDDSNDPDRGIKIFINIASITIVVGTVAALVISRLPKKKKTSRPIKEEAVNQNTEEKKEEVKHTPKNDRVHHNAPKKKTSNTKKAEQKK